MDSETTKTTMGDNVAAAARREARRKRILENSTSRLTTITGRDHTDEISDKIKESIPQLNEVYPDPDLERENYEEIVQPSQIFQSFGNFSSTRGGSAEGPDIFQLLNSFQNGSGSTFGAGFSAPTSPTTPQPNKPETPLVKFLKTKVHIVIMAISVYLLFATNNQFYTSHNVFLLLLIWEMAEVFLLKTYEKKTNLIGMVFLLGGVQQRHTTAFFKIFETLHKILKDVAIFIFFFVGSHILWEKFYFGKNFEVILGNFEILKDL